MGKVLALYSSKSFKEFILPSINNSNYEITLYKDIFELDRDLVLKLEVINSEWYFISDNYYHIKKENVLYENKVLYDEDLLNVFIHGKNTLSIIVKEVDRVFAVYEKYYIENQSVITIGKNIDNIIQYNYQQLVSKRHAEIIYENGVWILQDKGVNGVYVNSKRIQDCYELQFGDYINVVGLHMVFLNHILAIDRSNTAVNVNSTILSNWKQGTEEEKTISMVETNGKNIFHRSPRSISKIETDAIKIEAPPIPEKLEQASLMPVIGPAFTMMIPMLLSSFLMIYSSKASGTSSGIYMYSGLIMAIASAGINVFWTIMNLNAQKKKLNEKEIHRYEAYRQYLVKKTNQIKEKYEHNMRALNERYLAASLCIKYSVNTPELWNRNGLHSDFLSHRLGVGDLPFQVPIQIPDENFSLLEDNLTNKPSFILENYKTLYQVPLAVDLLKHKVIGVIGGANKKGALDIVQVLTAQIAANNCYTDVKMAFVYDNSSSADYNNWEYARWLPHVWSEDKKTRYVAADKNEASDIFYELTRIFRQREEQEKELRGKSFKPHFILIISDPSILEGELIAKYIFSNSMDYGLTTIMLAEQKEELPNTCRFIIENTKNFHGMYDIMQGEEERSGIEFDDVSYNQLCEFARRLANIEVQEVEEGGEIPNSLTFFDMYHANSLEDFHVLDRWRKNRTYENIRGIIGEKSGGKPCYLDVHEKYHGPHGLVAGTTGSGKSETLQTYMLSLALNYSPDDIGYFIIDYKGGGMANLFDGLPHLIGQISNLSGNQVHRAMVSIKSENRRRQQIFNENGVNNINLYTKLYKNGEAKVPIPHLFIIIDEFAELKREESDFMQELISVAQVGRSLGVHLILATQKPNGTVDDNIWSNSKFRLCLRVQDKGDSNDMLHKPDAAYITQAGRCYLQVGNDEVFELFQSGFSGAAYIQDDSIKKTEVAKIITNTGRIDLTGSYAKAFQKEKLLRNWLSTLEDCLYSVLNIGNRNLKDYLEEDGIEHLLTGIFTHMAMREIDYPKNTYNEKKLKDFIYIYMRAAEEEGNVISNVIAIAKEESIKLPEAKEKTQLDVVKEYLSKIAEENGYEHNLQLWLPVLPQYIYLEEFEEYREESFYENNWRKQPKNWSLCVLVGKLDDPQNQSQMPLFIDITEQGHLAVCGSVASGKSTFLQTFLYSVLTKYSPQFVSAYILDFSSKMMLAFETAAHIGGVMYENDNEKIAKFFTMMKGILKDRKELFHGGNYSQYVKVNGVTLPIILIIIDNFSSFNEKTEEKFEDFLIQLSKEGVNYGIYLIIGAGGFGSKEIPKGIAENIMNVIALQQPDRFTYTELLRTSQFDVIPEIGVKGRGLAFYGTKILEFQTALVKEAADDYQRLEFIQKKCKELNTAWNGKHARKIPEIPEKVIWSEFVLLEETVKLAKDKTMLPVGYNALNASIYSLNLRNYYCYLITGAARTGKKNFMKVLIESALLKEADICIMDSPEKLLRTYENREGITYINNVESILSYFQELTLVFKKRNKEKHEMITKEYEEDEIFDVMCKEKPYFIFIPDLVKFILMIADVPNLGIEGFLENILEKGRIHHIYFFGILKMDEKFKVSGSPVFNVFSSYKTGIHFGGNVSENPIFNFDYLTFKEQSEIHKAGIGMIPAPLYEDDPKKIIVPLVRGKKID